MPISYKLHLWFMNQWCKMTSCFLTCMLICLGMSVVRYHFYSMLKMRILERENVHIVNDFEFYRFYRIFIIPGVSRYSIEGESCYSEYHLSYWWERVLFTQYCILYMEVWIEVLLLFVFFIDLRLGDSWTSTVD